MSLPAEIEALLAKIDDAVDAHALLIRHNPYPQGGDTMLSSGELTFERRGCTAAIVVKLKGSRKKPSKIWGHGESGEAAVEALINALDHWAGAIK
jgi:hypothetical protein